jgi:hypothetical protein
MNFMPKKDISTKPWESLEFFRKSIASGNPTRQNPSCVEHPFVFGEIPFEKMSKPGMSH